MKGGLLGWNLKISGVYWDPWKLYLMFLSREIDIKTVSKSICVRFCIKFVVLNRSYSTNTRNATNLKTTISHRSRRNSGLLLLLFEFNNFSFLINIINNIIYTSGSCHQNPNQWQCSIIVTCLCLYHVTSLLHCNWKGSGHVTRGYILDIYVLV